MSVTRKTNTFGAEDWLPRVEELLKYDKPMDKYRHGFLMKKLLSNMDAYQEHLITLAYSIQQMRQALGKKLERLERTG